MDKLSDQEAFELSACIGKERFMSATLARQIARRRAKRGKPVEAYHCEHCGGFHIGQRHGDRRLRVVR